MPTRKVCVQNVVLISIASVMDPSLAPAGKHTLHAYLPATEPFHLWEGKLLSLALFLYSTVWAFGRVFIFICDLDELEAPACGQ